MHELSLTRSLVELAAEHAQSAPVRRVTLEIGRLSGVVPEAIRFCFDVCVRGTCLEGAELEIIEVPGRGRCRDCGAETPLDELLGQCSCGSLAIDPIAGRELNLKRLEIDG